MSTVREFKGLRITDFPSDYTIIDLETTGFASGRDKILEFAAIKIRDNEIVDEIQQLFNPKIHINHSVEKITGINNSMVINEPQIEEKLGYLIDWIGNDIIVGHNVNFDIDFLYDECVRILDKPLTNNYFDTLYVCKKLYPEASHTLTDMLCILNIQDNGNHHRALADCRDTYRLMCALKSTPEIDTIIKPERQKKFFKPELTQTTLSLRDLQNIISDVTCDNILTEDELFRLKEWVSNNEDLTGNYPYDVITNSINAVLEDGVIKQSELEHLLEILKEQLDPIENMCCHNSNIDFSDKCVCLSGDFSYGSKSEYAEKISACGAIIVNNVTKKTDILIVGSEGSDKWSCGNYGNKVKKALEMKEKCHKIIIIKENDIKL